MSDGTTGVVAPVQDNMRRALLPAGVDDGETELAPPTPRMAHQWQAWGQVKGTCHPGLLSSWKEQASLGTGCWGPGRSEVRPLPSASGFLLTL